MCLVKVVKVAPTNLFLDSVCSLMVRVLRKSISALDELVLECCAECIVIARGARKETSVLP